MTAAPPDDAPTADGGTRDAAPRDAGLEDAGADCVPRLEADAECHARCAPAPGGGDFAPRPAGRPPESQASEKNV